jgi:hypothetical protein
VEWCKLKVEFVLKLTRKISFVRQQRISKAKEEEEGRGKHKEANTFIVIRKSSKEGTLHSAMVK